MHGAQGGTRRARCLHQQHTVQALRHACVWVSTYPTHMGTHTQYLQLCRRHTVHCTHGVSTTPPIRHTPCWGLRVSQQSWVQPWEAWVPGGPAAWHGLGTFHGAKGEQGALALSCC